MKFFDPMLTPKLFDLHRQDLKSIYNLPPTQEILDIREFYKENRKEFFIDFWDQAGTNNALVPDISLEAVAEHLDALMADEFKTLIVVMPPRQGKSTLVSVMTPAYEWTLNPTLRILSTCYAKDYAFRDNKNMQDLILSKKYRQIWGTLFDLTKTSQAETSNDKGGKRVATSILGKNVGSGGELITLDDCNNITEMNSMTLLQRTNNVISNIMTHRQNFASKTKYIMAQHRCAHMDAVGDWLSKNDKTTCYINLRMEYEKKYHTVTHSIKDGRVIWEDPRTKEGELLSPVRYNKESIQWMKLHMGEKAYSALFQGNPVMDQAAIFKEEWFMLWAEEFTPQFEEIIMSIDTALSTTAEAAYSAMTCWGVFRDRRNHCHMMLLSKWTGKKEWTELRQLIMRFANDYRDVDERAAPSKSHRPPSTILIEAKANGLSLIQSLKRAGINCTKYYPPKTVKHDKTISNYEDAKAVRARICAPILESGRVWVRTLPPTYEQPLPSAQNFIRACVIFPSNAHASRDLVDTMTSTIDWLQRKGKLFTLDDVVSIGHNNMSLVS